MGPIEAYTSAVGETTGEFSGVRMTRVASAASIGASTLALERAVDLPQPGKIFMGGVVYRYDTVSGNTLQNVGLEVGGQRVPGLTRPAGVGDTVIDASGTYSALDALRRDIMSGTATGDDLNVLGNNVGLPRDPSLAGDDQYRALLQTVAYGRRVTMQGLRAALTALVGAGNFQLTEDLVNSRLLVKVAVKANAVASTGKPNITQGYEEIQSAAALGRSYLNGRKTLPISGQSVQLPQGSMNVGSILLPSEDVFTVCTLQSPAVVDPSWVQNNSSQVYEAAPTGNGSSSSVIQGVSSLYFTRECHILPTTHATATMQCAVNGVNGSDGRQLAIAINDGQKVMMVGLVYYNPTLFVGFLNSSTGALLQGGSVAIQTGIPIAFHTMGLRKRGTDYVQVLFDGNVVQTLPYSMFAASTLTSVQAGVIASGNHTVLLQNLAVSTRNNNVDYWMFNGTDGSVAAGSQVLSSASANFTNQDIGKVLRVRSSAVMNTYGGNNNGVYAVAYPSGSGASLTCFFNAVAEVGINASSFAGGGIANAQSIAVAGSTFRYPDDLGNIVTLSGGTSSANNGTFYIVDLIDPVTGYSLIPAQGVANRFNSSLPSNTSVATLQRTDGSTFSFVPQEGLSISMAPNFAAESNLAFTLSDAGVFNYNNVSSPDTASGYLRAAVPFNTNYNVAVGTVLGGYLQNNHAIEITGAAEDGTFEPPTWPLYANDANGFVVKYMQSLLAAGVYVQFSTY